MTLRAGGPSDVAHGRAARRASSGASVRGERALRTLGLGTVVVGVIVMALGCPAARPTLTVRVQAGLRAGLEIGYVDARLSRGAVPCTDDRAAIGFDDLVVAIGDQGALGEGTLTVAEFRDLEPGVYTVRARFRRPAAAPTSSPDSGPILVERCSVTTLSASRVVRIALTTDCLGGTVCPSPGGGPGFTECLNGRCVEPGCDPDDAVTAPLCCDRAALGAACDEDETLCSSATDCGEVVGCAGERRCIDGVCVEPDMDRCPAGQYCSVTVGDCVDDPGSSDAGAPDSGLRDGGPPDARLPDAGPPDAGPPDAGRDAFVCPRETCDNRTDDDCDGDTDCADPDCAARACDDGNACTVSDTCGGGVCTGPCGPGLVCHPGGTCQPCSARGELCCDGDVCDADLTCTRAFMGIPICQCGLDLTLCCAGDTCEPGLTCTRAFMGIPICRCGIESTLCCDGTRCDAPLRCSTAFMGIPICVP